MPHAQQEIIYAQVTRDPSPHTYGGLRPPGCLGPLADELTNRELERLLFPSVALTKARPLPEGYAYSRFCELCGEWLENVDFVMRQRHRAGEKLFVATIGRFELP